MKNKTLSFVIASVFALVFLMGAVSAATIFSDNFDDRNLNGWTAEGWDNAATYAESSNVENANLSRTISTSGYETIIVKYDRQLGQDWEDDDLFNVSWSVDGTTFTSLEEVVGNDEDELPDDDSFVSKTFNLPTEAENNSNFQIKIECSTNEGDEFCNLDNVIIEGTEIPEEPEETEPEEIQSCSLIGDNGNLKISIEDISVEKGYGDDEEWLPLDEIQIEIEVENDGDEKIKDIVVEWGLYNVDKEEWVIDDEENDFNLKDGDKETILLNFDLDDVDEFEDGDEYVFYVWATGEDTEFDPEKETCTSEYEDIEIIIESDFVILDDIEIADVVQCGAEVQISADVWNIGDSDQDEVKVIISNSQLGINEVVEVGDIDAFDSESLNVVLQLPEDTEEKLYYLDFKVYDEDNDQYENDFDDEKSFASVPLKVEGSCAVAAEASVSAVLEEGGQAGKPLTVKATIINTGDEQTTYMLNAASYAEWAESAQLDQSTVVLNSGESKEVLITFNVNSDALGDYLFNIEVLSDNELIVNQPVQVSIEKKGFGITGNAIGSKSYLWGIGILNVILIIIIIIVAIRIARK